MKKKNKIQTVYRPFHYSEVQNAVIKTFILLSNNKYCKGSACARDKNGRPVAIHDRTAIAWDYFGAVDKVTANDTKLMMLDVFDYVDSVFRKSHKESLLQSLEGMSVDSAHKRVLKYLKKAIEKDS